MSRSISDSIIESLNEIKREDCSINESVSIQSLIQRIIKIFGKIFLKEYWLGRDEKIEDYETIPTRWIKIKTTNSDVNVGYLIDKLTKKKEIDLNKLLLYVKRAAKVPYHYELKSNMRVILQSDRKKTDRIEIRFNRKLKDSGNVELDDLDTNLDDITIKKSISAGEPVNKYDKSNASRVATAFKEADKDIISDKIDFVKEGLSLKTKTMTKEPTNVEAIMKEGGCDKKTAENAKKIADSVFDKALELEPEITRDIIRLVRKLGGLMFGLDFRLKQGTSLGRKIVTDAFDPDAGFNGDLKKAAENVKDSIRYTAVFPIEVFTNGYKETKKGLERLGYREVRCKNFYKRYAEGSSQQKAIQCVYANRDGLNFELQFHTPESQGAKEVNHPLYEKHRSADSSVDEKAILDLRMVNISENVPDPEGVFTIEEH